MLPPRGLGGPGRLRGARGATETCFLPRDSEAPECGEEQCRFRNCRHDTEPGCAVKAALASGALSEERWLLYCSLGAENTQNKAWKKKISKLAREPR